MTDSRSIDPQALDRLKEWGGDKLAAQMVRLFLKNSGTRMDQIRQGAEAGDLDLKSSAANIGAEVLRTYATQVESASLDSDLDSVRSILPELETAYAEAISELETIQQGLAE
jgi:HPt (histidine-containing phosphotransfer) domain-containing protein